MWGADFCRKNPALKISDYFKGLVFEILRKSLFFKNLQEVAALMVIPGKSLDFR